MQRIFDIALGCLVLLGLIVFAVWLFIRAWKRSDDPLRLVSRWGITLAVLPAFVWIVKSGPLAPPLAAVVGIVLALVWAPSWAAMVCRPLTNLFDGGFEEEVKPLYSTAEGKRKFGKYLEAVAEIRQELERFPDDFPGQMLLAEVQAVDLHDLAAARETIEVMLTQEGHAEKNIAYALTRLAEWQIAADQIDAARQTLDRIVLMYPDTESAYHASQRLAHLNPTRLEEKKQSRRIVAPHLEENLGLRPDFQGFKLPPVDWDAKAEALVKQLDAYPADNDAREELALIYARHYRQMDLAMDQFEQMIAQPGVPARQVVRWLNALADLQLKEVENVGAARQSLQRIVDLYPDTPDAEKARQRMVYLNLEARGQQPGTKMKLGTYEQKIGLKPGPSPLPPPPPPPPPPKKQPSKTIKLKGD